MRAKHYYVGNFTEYSARGQKDECNGCPYDYNCSAVCPKGQEAGPLTIPFGYYYKLLHYEKASYQIVKPITD